MNDEMKQQIENTGFNQFQSHGSTIEAPGSKVLIDVPNLDLSPIDDVYQKVTKDSVFTGTHNQ